LGFEPRNHSEREDACRLKNLVSGRLKLDGINAAFDLLSEGKAVRQVIMF